MDKNEFHSNDAAIDLLHSNRKNRLATVAEKTLEHALVRIMESMLDLLADVHKQTLQVTQRVIKSRNEHLRIWDAILDRNAPEASRLMMQHLENVENELIRLQAEEQ